MYEDTYERLNSAFHDEEEDFMRLEKPHKCWPLCEMQECLDII